MIKNALFLAVMVPIAMTACTPQATPSVPTTISPDIPCSSLAPWGFPQAESLPKDPINSPGQKNETPLGFLCMRGVYAIGYDNQLRVPRWAVEMVSPANWQGEPGKVREDWRPDPFVPTASTASVSDYAKEITNGEIVVNVMVSHKNFAADEVAIGRTFYLSNTAPAIKKDESPDAWSRLEDQVVSWSATKKNLLVISGTLFSGGVPMGWTGHKEEQGAQAESRGVIAIPSHFYKIIVDMDKKSAIAFVSPNNDPRTHLLPSMATTVRKLEAASGITFFPLLPPEDAPRIMDRVVVEEWPID